MNSFIGTNSKHQAPSSKKHQGACSNPYARRICVWSLSFAKHLLQLLHLMAAGEGGECFSTLAFGKIRLQHAFEQRWNFAERNAGEDLFADARLGADAAAEDDVVTFARADLHALQADIADVMLRAGVRAAGEVDVDGLVQLHGLVEMRAERDGLAFRVGRGPFATGVAGAGDEAAENVRGLMMKSHPHELP